MLSALMGFGVDFVEFGQLVARARKAKGLSQTAIGSRLGMSRATISGIENATIGEIGIRKVVALCAALDLELIAAERSAVQTIRSSDFWRIKERSQAQCLEQLDAAGLTGLGGYVGFSVIEDNYCEAPTFN